MERVGFQRFADVLFSHGIQGARASQIDSQRHREDKNGGNAGLNMHAMEKQAGKGFVDDVNGGENQQSGFDERGEIFEFAVSVGVTIVGGLVGNADGKKGDDGGDQVESGVQGFGEHAQAARVDDQKGFKAHQDHGRKNTQQCRALLLLHGFLKAARDHHRTRLP